MMNQCNWAAILAGGDGRRLQSLTRSLSGDTRPKQFCRLLGEHTLLDETRARVARNVEEARTLYAVTRTHEPFYRRDLAGVRGWQMVEQPVNRGTTAAVVYTLARLRRLEAIGTVGFFPADHHYEDSYTLQQSVANAYAFAASHPDMIVLLGAEPDRPETDYGWIEPGRLVEWGQGRNGFRISAHAVARFCEKPSQDLADQLFARHCLWNTLIVVGRVGAFEALVADSVPAIWRRFAMARDARTIEEETAAIEEIYDGLPSSDFSHDVLARHPEGLAVMNLPDAGWTDLGHPERALAVMSQRERTDELHVH